MVSNVSKIALGTLTVLFVFGQSDVHNANCTRDANGNLSAECMSDLNERNLEGLDGGDNYNPYKKPYNNGGYGLDSPYNGDKNASPSGIPARYPHKPYKPYKPHPHNYQVDVDRFNAEKAKLKSYGKLSSEQIYVGPSYPPHHQYGRKYGYNSSPSSMDDDMDAEIADDLAARAFTQDRFVQQPGFSPEMMAGMMPMATPVFLQPMMFAPSQMMMPGMMQPGRFNPGFDNRFVGRRPSMIERPHDGVSFKPNQARSPNVQAR